MLKKQTIEFEIIDDKGQLNANNFVKYFLQKYQYTLLGGKPLAKTSDGWSEIGYKELQQNLISELDNLFDNVTVKMVSNCMFFLTRTGEDKGIVDYNDNINQYGIHFIDGLYDVKTGEFSQYTDKQKLFIKNTLQYTFHQSQSAKKPEIFIRFLKDVFKGEPDIADNIAFIQEFMGLLLIPNTMFEKALYIIGHGANGKGVLLNTIQAMLGENNCSSAGLNELMDKTTSYNLIGKLCNIDSDMFSATFLDKEVIKKIVSGEPITTKQLYSQPISFKPYARLICASNYRPKTRSKDDSITRRFFFLEFKNSFKGKEDIHLKDKVAREKELIMSWSLQGLKRLVTNEKFTLPKQVYENNLRFINSENGR